MKEKEICCFNRIYSALEGLQEAHTLAYRALAVDEGAVLELGEQYDGWEDGQTVFCPGLPEERAGTLLRWFYENGADPDQCLDLLQDLRQPFERL